MKIPYRTKSFEVSYKGKSTFITSILNDHIGSFHENGRFYEADPGQLLDYLWRHFEDRLREGTFLDIGAHVGNHSVFFREVLGMGGLSVEANPDLVPILIENVGSIFTVNGACSCLPGLAYTFVPPPKGNTGLGKILMGRDLETTPLNYTTSVDEIRRVWDLEITLLKIDVEGNEREVIAGAEETILTDRPFLIIETSDSNIIPWKDLKYLPIKMRNFTETWLFVSTA